MKITVSQRYFNRGHKNAHFIHLSTSYWGDMWVFNTIAFPCLLYRLRKHNKYLQILKYSTYNKLGNTFKNILQSKENIDFETSGITAALKQFIV